ncbi:hypothetical protein A2U01_0067730, partial [Trifolium medium]|nr:hypothetical protein [Trifolium medium]
ASKNFTTTVFKWRLELARHRARRALVEAAARRALEEAAPLVSLIAETIIQTDEPIIQTAAYSGW